jgi:hypothetical protein
MKKPNDGIWCRPIIEDDLLKWEALVLGPALSPYAYGFFTVPPLSPHPLPQMHKHAHIHTHTHKRSFHQKNTHSFTH